MASANANHWGVEHKIGGRCSVCHTDDFLPFHCKTCRKTFCAEHRCKCTVEASKVVPRCPLCSEIVVVREGENADQVIGAHIDAGCRKPKPKSTYNFKCSVKGCRKREAIECVCKRCGQNYCLAHRTEAAHKCSAGGTRAHNAMAGEIRRQEERERAQALEDAARRKRDADLRNARAHELKRERNPNNRGRDGRAPTRQAQRRQASPAPPPTDPMYANSHDEDEIALQQAIEASLRQQQRENSSRCHVS